MRIFVHVLVAAATGIGQNPLVSGCHSSGESMVLLDRNSMVVVVAAAAVMHSDISQHLVRLLLALLLDR